MTTWRLSAARVTLFRTSVERRCCHRRVYFENTVSLGGRCRQAGPAAFARHRIGSLRLAEARGGLSWDCLLIVPVDTDRKDVARERPAFGNAAS
jgi:hypothetical protein